ncbi:MAG: folate family ECF transporter S component [Solobacterium sp.]|nr:folate family ECF transporter S component [Solobacterium sp.]
MFTKEYWKSSFDHLKDIRYLTIMAVFIGMKVLMKSFFIPVTPTLRIYMTFLFAAVECSIIGPGAAIVSGCVTDLIGFMLFPNGAFFIGYTISEMTGHLVYALMLYRKKISVLRIFMAKFINNYFTNVILGSLWNHIIVGKAFLYYAGKSIIKNTLMLPIEVVLLVLLFNLLIPSMKQRRFISEENRTPIPWK